MEELIKKVAELKESLTGDMMKDMGIRDQIHNLEMKISGTKPMDTKVDCVGCGS